MAFRNKQRTDRPGIDVRKEELPEGNTLEVDTSHDGLWKYGLVWFALLFGFVGYIIATGDDTLSFVPVMAILGLPGLLFFHRSALILDRRRKQITRRDTILIPFTRTWPTSGKTIRMAKRMSREGRTSTGYAIYLGKHELCKKKKRSPASQLGRRIAAFLEVPYSA